MPEFDHIGYAVTNAEEKKFLMEDIFGFKFAERKEYDRSGVVSRLDFYETPGGLMELVEVNDPEAPINKFIESRGEGVHHICLRVDDIRATMAEWEAKGVKFMMTPPKYGSRNGLITFADPSTTGGLLTELIQYLKEGEEIPDWAQK
jgi:methylmalonyl-CoA epimerase